jgi:hypothetical protein
MPPLDEILDEAAAAERDTLARQKVERERREALAAHRIETALDDARRRLDRESGCAPLDLSALAAILACLGRAIPRADPRFRERARRGAAHILARASVSVCADYRGERATAAMPAPIDRDRLPPIPSATDDDL